MSWGFVAGAVITTVGGAISSRSQAKAAESAAAAQQAGISEGIAETRRASEQGLGFLTPFQELGQTGVEQAGFLTDPQAQFNFLQQNPLFKFALESANTQTSQLAAARGRLSAGDTLQQLSQNVLLAAQPLITQQKGSIVDLINLGSGTSRAQANVAIGQGSDITNLLTSAGDVAASGIVGAGRARAAGTKAITEGAATAVPLLAKAFGGQT